MPPRGSEGLDVTPILTHYLFLFTSILALIGWVTAFVAQIATTVQFGRPAVGTLWFAIFLQLFLIIGVLYTLASDSIAMHRFQISVFGAVAIVFAVSGVDIGIFINRPALNAMSAGWLILAMVDILWVLYFTSEEDSLALHIFNSLGTGGLTPPSRRRRNTRVSVHNVGQNGGYSANYSPGGGIGSHDVPYETKMAGVGSAPHSVAPPGMRSQNSFGAGSGRHDNASLGGTGVGSPAHGGAASLGGGDNTIGPSSPLMGSGAAGLGSGGGPGSNPAIAENPNPDSYSYRAKALYAYTASPDDPNEISFTKGEVLDIVDKQGKWWQARKADGSFGIAPSNYLQII